MEDKYHKIQNLTLFGKFYTNQNRLIIIRLKYKLHSLSLDEFSLLSIFFFFFGSF